jgi:hypothetical protein
MAEHPEVHGVVRLEDQGSAALRQIAQEIHKLSAAAAHAHHEIAHIHEEGVLSALREHTKEVGESFSQLGESVAHVHEGVVDLLPAIAALGAVGSIGGIFEMVASSAERFEGLEHAAGTIGLTTRELQRLHFAAEQTGISTEALDKGLERMNKNLAAAAHGQNKMVATHLKHAGIKLFADDGHLRNATEILPELEEALRKTGSAAERTKDIMDFMGRDGAQLEPMLTMSKEKMDELNKSFDRFHPLPPEGPHILAEYAEALKEVSTAGQGFKDAVAVQMAPILLPLQHELANFLAHQSELAGKGQGIGGLMAREGAKLGAYLEGVDWDKVGQDMEGVAHAADEVAQAMGGWGRAAEVVGGIMAAKAVFWAASPVLQFGGAVINASKALWELDAAEAGAALGAASVGAAWLAAGGAIIWAYKANSDAYDDYLERRHSEKDVKRLKNDVREHYLDMTPEKRSEFRKYQQHAIANTPIEGPGNFAHHVAYNGYVISDEDEAEAKRRDMMRAPVSVHTPTLPPAFGWLASPWDNTQPDQTFGEMFGEHSSLSRAFGPSVFSQSIYPHSASGDTAGAGSGREVVLPVARVEGNYTLHIDLSGAPPGTKVTLERHGNHDGPRLDIGHYDNRH